MAANTRSTGGEGGVALPGAALVRGEEGACHAGSRPGRRGGAGAEAVGCRWQRGP